MARNDHRPPRISTEGLLQLTAWILAVNFVLLLVILWRQQEFARQQRDQRGVAEDVRRLSEAAEDMRVRYSGLTVEVELVTDGGIGRAEVQVAEDEPREAWVEKLREGIRGLREFHD